MKGFVCKSVRHWPAVLCVAILILISTVSVNAQQVNLIARHVPKAVENGQARQVDLLPGTQRLKAAINLPLRNQAELEDLLQRLNDPQSPDYHHFLSVQEFTDRFAPTQHDYDAVVQFAKTHGLTVTNTVPNRRLVDVEGSVTAINKAFHVVMSVYQHPTENRTFFSADREPTMDLSVPVLQITGLDNYVLPYTMLKKRDTSKAARVISNITGSGPGNTYLPSDIRAAYYGSGSLTGSGQTIGIYSFDGFDPADVQLFYTNTGMTSSVPIQNAFVDGYTGNGCQETPCNDGEQVLDIVNAIGMAPGISKEIFYAGSNDTDILNKMATDNAAKILSCSWGWNPADGSSDDPIFLQMQAQGQTFLTASGDSGALDSGTYFFPADDPNITLVGGTSLTTNGAAGSWASEVAWSDSGGGISQNGYAIPTYQKLSGVINSSNQGSTSLRNGPDVAAEGDFDNYTCSGGSCSGGWGGTSFATPRWAGFIALVNQQSLANGNSTAGFLNTNVYNLGVGTNYHSDFHDITSGSNPSSDGGNPGYPAVAGFDLVTGWGSPNGSNLINALSGNVSPTFTLSTDLCCVTVKQGSSGKRWLTVNRKNGFTGRVTMSASGLPSGVTAAFNPPTIWGQGVVTFTATSTAKLGNTAVTITGVDSSKQTVTIWVTVTK